MNKILDHEDYDVFIEMVEGMPNIHMDFKGEWKPSVCKDMLGGIGLFRLWLQCGRR